jgi:hypothetical protein
MPVIPALGRLRLGDHKFEANLGYKEKEKDIWTCMSY